MDKNKILYCEKAKCLDNCPVNFNAVCKPMTNETMTRNDPKLNKCVCSNGWGGTDCSEKIFVSFKLVYKYQKKKKKKNN